MLTRRLFAALALAAAPLAAQERATQPPTLVVMFTVDQLRPDYFTRWERQLTGGLGRLLRGGAVFLDGYQDHAITETAPGHSTTLAGRFPRSTGIVANSAGVEDPQAPLIGARGSPASPFRFRGTTLIDWMRYANPASRALSVSRKDRGAILPLGRAKQQAFWLASNGMFTTSRYYADTLPTWVTAFNARQLPQQWAGKAWTLLLDSTQYPEPDSVPTESGGRGFTFPHAFPSNPAQAASYIASTPMSDELTLAFALQGVQELDLGAGPQPDLLAISLSSTDAVGHRFGPDSRELHDQVLRLDRYLAVFFDSLYKLRDSSRVVLALTADHGVSPIPGTRSHDPNQGAGFVRLGPPMQPFLARLRAAGIDSTAYTLDGEMLFLDSAAFARAGLDVDSISRVFAAEIAKVPGVLRADVVSTLATRDTTTDYVARRWLHMLPPDLPVRVVITLRPYWYWAGVNYATHGTPHDTDARVPVIFAGAGIRPGRYRERALVVDIAPTLAAVLGVRPLERLDGRVLRTALRR
ncbi:MAG TPA: alkaline phosphatase family protein [Gemmatimonadaceae bacterium]